MRQQKWRRSRIFAVPAYRSDQRARRAPPCVANVDPRPPGDDGPPLADAVRSAEQCPAKPGDGQCSSKPDFFAPRRFDDVRALLATFPVGRGCYRSIFGRAPQIQSGPVGYFFPPQKVPPLQRLTSPWPDALHPRCPGARGQVQRALPVSERDAH